VKFLLDSVILIDHLNGVPAATAFLVRHGEDSVVSVISRAEVLAGVPADDAGAVRALLDRFPALVVDKAAADLAATLRRAHRWKLPDALQAALAGLHGLKLVTRNVRDFPPRRHGFVLVPYR
jgi:predicted nucleic acid-binding protein